MDGSLTEYFDYRNNTSKGKIQFNLSLDYQLARHGRTYLRRPGGHAL